MSANSATEPRGAAGAGETFVSTGAFKTPDLADTLELARREGFGRLELSSGARWRADWHDLVMAAARGGTALLVHNYFPPPEKPFVLNLAADDEETLGLSREHARRAVDLCAEVGSPFYSIHSGFAFRAKPSQLGKSLADAPRTDLASAQKVFEESLRQLCRHARGKGVRVAFENNVLAPFNLIGGKNLLALGATPEQVRRTLEAVGADNLGVLYDVAHAKVTAGALGFSLEDFTAAAAPRLYGFHLSDNDGSADTNEPVREDSWFLPLLARFPEVPAVLESYKLEPEEIRRCLSIIARARRPAGVS